MPLPALTFELRLYRVCSCGQIVREPLQAYRLAQRPGETVEQAIDRVFGQANLPIRPIRCAACGRAAWPTDFELADVTQPEAPRVVQRLPLGTPGLEVVTRDPDAAPYALVEDPDTAARRERGAQAQAVVWDEGAGPFWTAWTAEAQARWTFWAAQLTAADWAAAGAALGVSPPAAHPTAAAWQRALAGLDRAAVWRAANTELVERNLAWLPPAQWDAEGWVRRWGRERVRWAALHLPLPEELEPDRTRFLAQVQPPKTHGPEAVLWTRIQQLGTLLAKQERRSQDLAQQLAAARQELGRVQAALGEVRAEAERLRAALAVARAEGPDRILARRARDWEALARDLHAEVRRLAALLPVRPAPPPEPEEATSGPPGSPIPAVPAAVPGLPGPIAVTGVDGGPVPEDVRPIASDAGPRAVEQAVAGAAAVVVLTRRTSHATLWLVRLAAAAAGVPVAYSRETAWDRVRAAAQRAWAGMRAGS
ncbi:MAG: hypothetical protein OWV35_11060 [Firmicutes bacterium]|nr:hypothetical protein [Bacillota bacterium]